MKTKEEHEEAVKVFNFPTEVDFEILDICQQLSDKVMSHRGFFGKESYHVEYILHTGKFKQVLFRFYTHQLIGTKVHFNLEFRHRAIKNLTRGLYTLFHFEVPISRNNWLSINTHQYCLCKAVTATSRKALERFYYFQLLPKDQL